MVLWWAAFIFLGLVFQPDMHSAGLVAGFALFGMLAACALRSEPAWKMRCTRGGLGSAAARYMLIVSTGLLFWVDAGVERARIDGTDARYRGVSARPTVHARTGRGKDATRTARSAARPTAARRSWCAALRTRFSRVLTRPPLRPLTGAMLGALLLGRRADIPRRMRDSYEYCGVAHFLALSGLHLGIIAAPIAALLAAVRLHRFHRSVLLVFILLLYAAVAGYPPSLVRAVSLTASVVLYRALGLKTGLVRPLVLGGVVVACIDPETTVRAGYQLSFSAVCGIALVGLPLIDRIGSRLPRRRGGAVVRALLVPTLITLSIQLFTLPLVLSMFHRVSLLAPLMNLLMMIPVCVFLYTGCAFLLLPVGPLRAVLAVPLNLLARVLRDVPAAFSHRPHPAIYRGDIETVSYCAGIALLAFGLARVRRRRAAPLTAAALCIAVSVIAGSEHRPSPPRNDGCEDIGFGYRLIDCKAPLLYIENDTGWYHGRGALRRLWSRGVRSLGAIIIGGGDGERRYGVRHLLERIGVGEIVCTPYTAELRADLVRTAAALGVPVRTVSRGDTVRCGTCAIEILQPVYPPRGEEVIGGCATTLRCRLARDPCTDGGGCRSIVLPPVAGAADTPDRR